MTDIDYNELYSEYLSLRNLVKRPGFISLMEKVESTTDFLNSPASTKYHLCVKHGLLYHSVSVCKLLIKLTKTIFPGEIDIDSTIIVALLHDLGKAGTDKAQCYIEREPSEKQKQCGYKASPPYDYNQDILWMNHEDRSLYLINKLCHKYDIEFCLTEEEWGAIAYHNEPWHNSDSSFHKNKLMTALQNCDYISACYMEE